MDSKNKSIAEEVGKSIRFQKTTVAGFMLASIALVLTAMWIRSTGYQDEHEIYFRNSMGTSTVGFFSQSGIVGFRWDGKDYFAPSVVASRWSSIKILIRSFRVDEGWQQRNSIRNSYIVLCAPYYLPMALSGISAVALLAISGHKRKSLAAQKELGSYAQA